MKRYLAFLSDVYYPSPAMDDLVNDFDSERDAVDAIDNEAEKQFSNRGYDTLEEYWKERWAFVYDTVLRKNIIELPKDRNLNQ